MHKFIRADVCFEYPNGSKSDPYITAGCGENDMVLYLPRVLKKKTEGKGNTSNKLLVIQRLCSLPLQNFTVFVFTAGWISNCGQNVRLVSHHEQKKYGFCTNQLYLLYKIRVAANQSEIRISK